MIFVLSWLIPRERRECSLAKPMRLTFLWEAKAGGRAECSCGKCSALRSPSHRAAMADAACCNGRCTAVRHLLQDTAMWRGVWQAYHCRAVPSPSMPSANTIGMHLLGASLFILYSRPVPWRLASGRLAWYLCVAASPAGVGCGRFTSGIRPSR